MSEGLIKKDNAAELMRQGTDVASACKQIVSKTALQIGGQKYVRVEGWQSIAAAYGCVLSAGSVKREQGGITAIGEVRRMSDGAVLATAEGYVGDDEATWGKREEYAKRAMAQTRAMGRAARSAFAFVVTLMDAGLETTPAEEVPEGGFDNAKPVKEASPTPMAKKAATIEPQAQETGNGEVIESFVKDLQNAKNSKFDPNGKRGGKNWENRWGILLEDDPQGRTLGTFDTEVAATAEHALDNGKRVRATISQKGKFWNVEALEIAVETGAPE